MECKQTNSLLSLSSCSYSFQPVNFRTLVAHLYISACVCIICTTPHTHKVAIAQRCQRQKQLRGREMLYLVLWRAVELVLAEWGLFTLTSCGDDWCIVLKRTAEFKLTKVCCIFPSPFGRMRARPKLVGHYNQVGGDCKIGTLVPHLGDHWFGDTVKCCLMAWFG